MPFSSIDKGSKYFNTVLNSGNGNSPKSITGFGFQPDLVWTKTRSYGNNHTLFDSVRGAGSNKELSSNSTSAEGGVASGTYGYLSSFDTDGFTATSGSSGINYFNYNGDTYVNWGWKANGSGSSNTSGTITSTVSANTTSGFSIVSYTGTGANATVGHGLGVAPKMVICKTRNTSADWYVYHASMGTNKNIYLNTTGASTTSNLWWNNTAPTSTVFSLGDQTGNNGSGITIIAYCFAEVKGFSKFGSYTGNGSTDGTFVYTGFKPAFVMTKSSSTGGTYYDWGMMDNKRANSFNVIDAQVCANLSDQENSANIGSQKIDFLSNGFKPRVNGSSHNGSGVTYIYMAFAENPFVTSKGLPVTAR